MAKMRNELAVVANKAKELLDFCHIFEGDGPVGDGFHLFGINGNLAVGNDMS